MSLFMSRGITPLRKNLAGCQKLVWHAQIRCLIVGSRKIVLGPPVMAQISTNGSAVSKEILLATLG